MERTRINIISGFLGSGKTSLIKKILNERKNRSISLEKTVIIENEFGDVSIDSFLLKDSNISIREINSGCICCSVVGDFEKSLKEIKSKFNPDEIIIEPSGVGRLSDIVSTCKKHEDKFHIHKIITVVNPVIFDMYLKNFGEFYTNQISNSNIVIFSRYDQAKNLGIDFLYIENEIKKLNKNILIVSGDWNDMEIFPFLDGSVEANTKKRFKKARQFLENKSHNPRFESITIDVLSKFSETEIRNILNIIRSDISLGNILRVKGFVGRNGSDTQGNIIDEDAIFFEFIPNDISIKKAIKSGNKTVVIIGERLNTEKIRQLFKA